jgi:hypothetical protein
MDLKKLKQIESAAKQRLDQALQELMKAQSAVEQARSEWLAADKAVTAEEVRLDTLRGN